MPIILAQRSRLDGNGDLTVRTVGENLSTSGANRVTFGEIPVNEALNDGVAARITVRDTAGNVAAGTYASVTEGLALVALSSTDYITDINAAGPLSNVRLGGRRPHPDHLADHQFAAPGRRRHPQWQRLRAAGRIRGADPGRWRRDQRRDPQPRRAHLPHGGWRRHGSGMDTATISSQVTGAGTALSKIGEGKLIFSGDNQYGGPTFINEGILNIQRSTGLGATAQATSVRSGATLELEQTTFGAVNVTVEGLTLEGTGFNDLGAIRNVAGNNSWAGNISQAGPNTNLLDVLDGFPVITSGTTFYEVEAGSSLNLSGAIISNC